MTEAVESVSKMFGCNVFNDVVMRERLPKNIYKTFRKTVIEGAALDPSVADVMANAMKDWAIEKGATHFSHWFQPMTGSTAEKHDSFISPTSEGRIIMEFSGKELAKGEPDASSFPSGGLRATFEARGYTAWDCTSPVFVKEDGKNITLFIPCAFCSYSGAALDKKTPLLRSMDAIEKQAMRVLKVLGNTTTKRVFATLGAEQEYFLVEESLFNQRLDLVLAGRTILGGRTPKGQEMNDHYFGSLTERVASYMNEVNIELWKLGVLAKTQHNEVSPGQYELAPVFSTINVASDHNQLVMDILRKVAKRHGLACLLHEKPFAGVNGSGKHVNWSLSTDDGINLLDPGKTPHENMIFLVFLGAVIKAVDEYGALLSASVANAGNEHRLGGNEAPPAIISIFLGDQLSDIVEQLANGKAKSSKQSDKLKLGVSTLPALPRDCTDRNRTSPFAFTGNKFEFRMVGASQSPSGPSFVINTIVADALMQIADELEKADDVSEAASGILNKIANMHKKIIFNGDNYSQEWKAEAKKRGLPDLKCAIDAISQIDTDKNVKLFELHGVLSKEEVTARAEILMDYYSKTINIEAKTMLSMVNRQILPAVSKFAGVLADSVNSVKKAGIECSAQIAMLKSVCKHFDELKDNTEKLSETLAKSASLGVTLEKARAYNQKVVPAMQDVRKFADSLEMIVDSETWPIPTYAEMLFMK